MVQQPPRGHGKPIGGNNIGWGQRASGRGSNQIEARQTTLVYTTTCGKVRDIVDVIVGTFYIYFIPYFDISSTHSYISSFFLLIWEFLLRVLLVRFMYLVHWISQCKLIKFIEGVHPANLMELPFGEFNLMMCIDWLVEYRVNLNCATKRVTLRSEDDVEIVMVSEL